MARCVSVENLLNRARMAAGTRNVREAVRDLTLHALRGRLLTAAHIATVVRTVGEGIESSGISRIAPARETRRGAWAGLEDAVGQALQAVELATREVAEGRAPLSAGEREQLLAELAQMERSLGKGWENPRVVPASLKRRIASLTALLQRAGVADPSAGLAQGNVPSGSGNLAFLASGVLLGLTEEPRRPSEGALS